MKKEYISPEFDIVNFSWEKMMANSSIDTEALNITGTGINVYGGSWESEE